MRARYQAKRHTKKWKERRKRKHLFTMWKAQKMRKQIRKPQLPIQAPDYFSVIKNTEEVLGYLNNARDHLKKGQNVTLDISNVSVLTPPTVALMVASINNPNFIYDSVVKGNAPNRPELHKLFTESGFYDFVQSTRTFPRGSDGMLHKETHQKVVSSVAKDAVDSGVKHVFNSTKPIDSLYEILIEMMSNTNNHADLNSEGSCYWWLYVYNDPQQSLTSYTFLDLGVGIFKSAAVSNFLKNMTRGTVLYPNTRIAEDLLAGRIKSRAEVDAEIRGKGIPQIVENAKDACFGEFYIISNDVKMNLKTMEIVGLKNPLNGTMLYWELRKE